MAPSPRVRIGILTKVTAELVDTAIAKHDRAERRRRLLSARLVVCFVLALCLFARESYEEVLGVLYNGVPCSRALERVNRSLLCRARARLGQDVPETNVITETGANRAGPTVSSPAQLGPVAMSRSPHSAARG
ncbi:transposase domain-containing protein [Streptomyces sp. NPDC001221]